MTNRTTQRMLAVAFCAAIGFSGPTVAATPKPGLWHSTTQVWIDGKEMPGGAGVETECVTAAEAVMSPKDMLEQAKQGVREMHEAPWVCSSFSQERADATGYSFDFKCSSPVYTRAEGTIRFEAGERRYRSEINSRSHLVNMGTVVDRSLTVGQWRADRCE